ncbi:MAG: AraC family transcriptional regulator [Clostridiales bacterium]|nr:AraC family transcriptional regulator [Clostridiales bacterium]
MADSQVCLKAIGISKQFGHTKALDAVDFSLNEGEIHTVLGTKGAGKTAMHQVFSGAISIDSGYLEIYGKRPRSHNPSFARSNNMQSLYEEQYLMQDLTVAENIFMGEYIANRAGILNYKKLKYHAEEIFERLKVPINSDMLPVNLTEFEKQVVQMARVYANKAGIVLADNIASLFSDGQKQQILEILREMAQNGIGVVYFTHIVEDAIRISDRITVLRDGRRICVVQRKSFDLTALVRDMVGYDEISVDRLELLKRESEEGEGFELSKAIENNGNLAVYLKHAIDFINENLENPISPKMVADAVHLSSGYLMLLFKNHMNTSIMEYTYKRRIEKSKELLADPSQKISQVAMAVGIPNSQYFSVLFKKYTNMTPKEYRKTCGH